MSALASWPVAVATVYRTQLARLRVARVPLLFVAVLQSLGLVVLLRGVLENDQHAEHQQVVAGAVVLVSGFVALNLLAQRFGQLAATRGLDHFVALGVPGSALVLGVAAAFASFALPGSVVVLVVGALLFDLSLATAWLVVAAVVVAAVALSGLGALLGLLAPRPELATVAGQLGMTLVLFLGLVRPERLPDAVRAARWALPSSPPTDVVRSALAGDVDAAAVGARLAVALVVGVLLLAAASRALTRVVDR